MLTSNKYCDYCGDVIFIGDWYFVHKGMRVCGECARSYAWAVFEEEAARQQMHFDQLLDLEPKDE